MSSAAAEPQGFGRAADRERADPRFRQACRGDRRRDTGSDCIGTSKRQGALSITQLEIMPRPPEKETSCACGRTGRSSCALLPRTTRARSAISRENTEFFGVDGAVKELRCLRVDEKMQDIPGSEFKLRADLVLLAMGFIAPRPPAVAKTRGETGSARNVAADTRSYKSSRETVFACATCDEASR